MDARLSRLIKTKSNTIRIFKKLQWVFFAAFALYCAIVAAIVVYIAFMPFGYEYVGPDSIISFCPIAFNVIAGGLAIFILGVISREIGKGSSPFTFRISALLNVLALVLLVSFIATLFIPPGTQIGAIDGATSTGMAVEYEGNPNSAFNLDFKTLLISIACFAMSAVFRYGAILQIETDDLV